MEAERFVSRGDQERALELYARASSLLGDKSSNTIDEFSSLLNFAAILANRCGRFPASSFLKQSFRAVMNAQSARVYAGIATAISHAAAQCNLWSTDYDGSRNLLERSLRKNLDALLLVLFAPHQFLCPQKARKRTLLTALGREIEGDDGDEPFTLSLGRFERHENLQWDSSSRSADTTTERERSSSGAAAVTSPLSDALGRCMHELQTTLPHLFSQKVWKKAVSGGLVESAEDVFPSLLVVNPSAGSSAMPDGSTATVAGSVASSPSQSKCIPMDVALRLCTSLQLSRTFTAIYGGVSQASYFDILRSPTLSTAVLETGGVVAAVEEEEEEEGGGGGRRDSLHKEKDASTVLAAMMTAASGSLPPKRSKRSNGGAPREGPPLRIAYVSPDLRRHAVGWSIAGALAAHNRQRVHVGCFFSGAWDLPGPPPQRPVPPISVPTSIVDIRPALLANEVYRELLACNTTASTSLLSRVQRGLCLERQLSLPDLWTMTPTIAAACDAFYSTALWSMGAADPGDGGVGATEAAGLPSLRESSSTPAPPVNEEELLYRLLAGKVEVQQQQQHRPPHIIIDLAGDTSGAPIYALRKHPAPLQLAYMGSPLFPLHTAAADGLITDAITSPPDMMLLPTKAMLSVPPSGSSSSSSSSKPFRLTMDHYAESVESVQRTLIYIPPPFHATAFQKRQQHRQGAATSLSLEESSATPPPVEGAHPPPQIVIAATLSAACTKRDPRLLDAWANILRRAEGSALLRFKVGVRSSACAENVRLEIVGRGVSPSLLQFQAQDACPRDEQPPEEGCGPI